MNKFLLIGILSSAIVATAQADIYCPTGPADCIKTNTNKITCTAAGNTGTWKFSAISSPLPNPNTHYFFTFMAAHSKYTKVPVTAISSCSYFNFQHGNNVIFTSHIPLVPNTRSEHWKFTKHFSYVMYCVPKAADCPFKKANS